MTIISDFDSALAQNMEEIPEGPMGDELHAASEDTSGEDSVTALSPQDFENFVQQLKDGENDSQLLAARERLANITPVWED